MKKNNNLYIGLMSGTSMDGIDAVLMDVSNHQVIAALTRPYSLKAKEELDCFLTKNSYSLEEIAFLDKLLGQEFAAAVQELLIEASIAAENIQAIGSHGQTVAHSISAESAFSMQLGSAHAITALTGIPVVADFRSRDIFLGGQGAPLTPLYHQALFAKADQTIALLNIGGISNITILYGDKQVQGWDLGPGNCLMDQWIFRHLGAAYDKNGLWAAKGSLISELLDKLLSDKLVRQPPPKSFDKADFSLAWLSQFIHKDYRPEDIQATLLHFTAACISQTILQIKPGVKQVYLCGGGAHNALLFKAIENELKSIQLAKVDALGYSADYIEAMCFAWLADKCIKRQPLDLSHITGSCQAHILGVIYPC